ncbi:MAG: transposase [Candidatus Endobugula sp.]
MARGVLQEVAAVPVLHQQLKRLTRRRNQIVDAKVRYIGRLQSDLQSISPGLVNITGAIDNLWFLRLLSSANKINKLSGLRSVTLLKIPGIGKKYLAKIQSWQSECCFSEEAIWVGSMIIEDAKHVLSLVEKIKYLDTQIDQCNQQSDMAQCVQSMPGFGVICSGILTGEIGNIDRFEKESSLSMYMGMSALDNSSGLYKGSKIPRQVNKRIKAAMMIALERHRHQVPESQKYYEKNALKVKSTIRLFGL